MHDLEFLERTANLDLAAFWDENARCLKKTPVGFNSLSPSATKKPRCGLTFTPDEHWLFELFQVPSTIRYYHDKNYRDNLHRQVNSLSQKNIGKTFFDEDTWENSPKRIENLFGCGYTFTEGSTPWLISSIRDQDDFVHILDHAESTDIMDWAFPDPYLKEWEQRKNAGKPLQDLGSGSRGPATIMTSVLPVETVFFWIVDRPHLMHRFVHILTRKMIELNRYFRTFSGNTQSGWWITDDNSALFNQRMYSEYCVPVLSEVLSTFAPLPSSRHQHSDSSMGHLLDEQLKLGINSVNYGPEVDAAFIRQKMPDAVIHGQIPPFLLRNGSPDQIRQRVHSDFIKAGESGGLILTTAGSLAAGTSIGRMRWLMHCVQEITRYA